VRYSKGIREDCYGIMSNHTGIYGAYSVYWLDIVRLRLRGYLGVGQLCWNIMRSCLDLS
jgi:hypothetical protein